MCFKHTEEVFTLKTNYSFTFLLFKFLHFFNLKCKKRIIVNIL